MFSAFPIGSVQTIQTIEDILVILHRNQYRSDLGLLGTWDSKFIESVMFYSLSNGKALTTAQAKSVLKMISKLRNRLVDGGIIAEKVLDDLIRNPQYERPLVETKYYPNEVRYVGGNLLGFRFRRKPELVALLKIAGGSWDWSSAIWVVELNMRNVDTVMRIVGEHNFSYTDEVAALIAEVMNSSEEPEMFAIDTARGAIVAAVGDPLIADWIEMTLMGEVM